MPNKLWRALERLRETLSNRTEQAYTDRDTEAITDRDQDYAAGEAHAYGIAEADVRHAQKAQANDRVSDRRFEGEASAADHERAEGQSGRHDSH